MTFEDYLPAVIVGGYALMSLLIWAGGKLRGKLPPEPVEHEEQPSGRSVLQPQDGARRIHFWARVSTWAAVLVGIGTTVVWLTAALDLSGLLELGLVLLGLVGFGLVFAYAMQSESRLAKFAGGLYTLVLAAIFWFLLLSPLLYLIGLTRTVDLHVTAAFETTGLRGSLTGSSVVQGDYVLDGATHSADFVWLSFAELPANGATLRVGVSPTWPTQIIENAGAAWFMLATGGGTALIIGLGLLGATKLANRRASATAAAK